MKREKIILIDGSSYFFRAYYAITRLSTSSGFPTNAIFGFVTMLMKVLETEKPTHLAIAFDTAKPTFRKELYAEYKANREAPPEDLIVQIPHIQRVVDCFGITRVEKEGFEADDVLGTLAARAVKRGYDVEIITGDKDLMQLVNEHVNLYDTMKDKRINREGVKERFGIFPEQIVDLFALMGDSSDNIPGVTGIGEKTASDLINTYGSLDGIYENIDKIKQEKRRETLKKEKEMAYLSQQLATVHCDMDLGLELDFPDMKYSGPHLDKLQAFFQEMEFHNLLKRFGLGVTESSFQKGKYETVSTPERLGQIVGQLKKCALVSVDTETTSLRPREAKLVGVSLCGEPGQAFYIPVGHHAIGAPDQREIGQMEAAQARDLLRDLLESPTPAKVGQNLKYDLQILRNWGISLSGITDDTLLASYLIDPSAAHNLDALALRYLSHKNITYEEVTGKGRMQISFAEVAVDKATEYSGEDADVTLRIHQKIKPELEKAGLEKLYNEVEVPLLQVLADMEYTGILIDEKKLRDMSESLLQEMGTKELEIFALAGESFNINSPKQLGQILFTKLGLPVVKKTKTGVSTDESVLVALSDKHAICAQIVKYRELVKLRSTYVEGLLAERNAQTGRVHTSYNQTVTATGRLSSSNPNLQNIPVGGDSLYDMRSVFIAAPGHELVCADYSQVELRLLAHMSGDPELKRAFEADEDIHSFTGRLIFGGTSISPEQRKIAKTINFGVVYGQSAYGLAQMLKISPGEAKAFIDTYFQRYSKVRAFLNSLIDQARGNGFVSTLMGRRRYFPEINSKNRMIRDMAERGAINAPIQGSAADMIKVAMVRLARRLTQEKCQSKIILQVHDELVLEVPPPEKAQVERALREEMEGAMPLCVPLKVDMGSGKTWGDA